MVKLLHTANPDGGSVPVIVDSGPGAFGISEVELFRGESEGSSRALHANVTFDATIVTMDAGTEYDFGVWLYVLTEGHVATMTDGTPIKDPSDVDPVWDLSTNSAGSGPIHAVLVKTYLNPIDNSY